MKLQIEECIKYGTKMKDVFYFESRGRSYYCISCEINGENGYFRIISFVRSSVRARMEN